MDKKDAFLRLDIKKWDTYWNGSSNNKYPVMVVLNLEEMSQKDKLQLLVSILNEREGVCRFLGTPLRDAAEVQDRIGANPLPPILIPSSGKNAGWMFEKNEKRLRWWWARMAAQGVPVVFLVSNEELETYQKGCTVENLYAVGYDGFGIGCGRAAAAQLLARWGRPGIITDDRTQEVTLRSEDGSKQSNIEETTAYEAMIALSDGSVDGFVCSVAPKFLCNILTIIRADRPRPIRARPRHFCFSPLFLSSKEDLSLALVMAMVATAMKVTDFVSGDNDFWRIIVHTDTRNPAYENKSIKYSGGKGFALSKLCESSFFRDANGDALDAAEWKNVYSFNNMWDVIKMQESALHQLIDSIGPKVEPTNSELLKQLLDHFLMDV